jgi:methionyl-tRNA formyltransferase
MHKNKIGFAGEGWGGLVAVKSLQKYFYLECFTSDKYIKNELTGNYNLINSFDEFNCDIIICAGYKPIIAAEFIKKHRIINIHYSLLPKYRGFHSTAWAIMNGEKSLGLSIHLMNKYIDDGPILHQFKIENDQISSAADYMKLMNEYIKLNLGNIILKYYKGNLIPKEQDKSKASWVGKRSEKHNLINFHKCFEFNKRLFRILQPPYPSPQTYYRGNLYFVGKASYHLSSLDTDISRILNIDEEGLWIKSKGGYIILNDIKDVDGKIINNNNFKIGNYLND